MGKPLDELFEKQADDEGGGRASPFAPQYPKASPATFAAYGALTPMIGPTAASMVGPGVAKALSPRSDESIERETVQELFDPGHEAEMQRIKTQAMLSEFMTSDPVISTYDPDEVTSAYNHISQLAPRASMQPSLMRGLLRKLLQQQDTLEAFDVDQLVGIEKGLKGLADPQEAVAPHIKLWPGKEKE